jgi:hypothetical protein
MMTNIAEIASYGVSIMVYVTQLELEIANMRAALEQSTAKLAKCATAGGALQKLITHDSLCKRAMSPAEFDAERTQYVEALHAEIAALAAIVVKANAIADRRRCAIVARMTGGKPRSSRATGPRRAAAARNANQRCPADRP